MTDYKPMQEEAPLPYTMYNYDDVQDEKVMDAVAAHPKGKPLNDKGGEVMDGIPLEPPLGYNRTKPLYEQIREQVMLAKKLQEAEEGGVETFEEADDFDVGDDYDPTSPYEVDFDPMPDADKAALSSQGRDVDAILGPHKPNKKKSSSADQAETGTEAAQQPESGQPPVAAPKP